MNVSTSVGYAADEIYQCIQDFLKHLRQDQGINNQQLSMVILTFGYSVEIHETILLTFTLFSSSLYIWNPSLINSLYKRDQGIPLLARLTLICRSYSQEPKSTTHGRHIWSSKYVMYGLFFVIFLVSRPFQFRVRKEKGGARRIWTNASIMMSEISFQSRIDIFLF